MVKMANEYLKSWKITALTLSCPDLNLNQLSTSKSEKEISIDVQHRIHSQFYERRETPREKKTKLKKINGERILSSKHG